MKFRYETSYEHISEFSAPQISQKTFANYSGINHSLAGTGIRFKNGPLSAREAYIFISLIDSYLSKEPIPVQEIYNATYSKSEESTYTFYHGLNEHVFTFNEASILVREKEKIHWRDKILLQDNITDVDKYQIFSDKHKTKKENFLSDIMKDISKYIESRFRFGTLLVPVKVEINMNEESLISFTSVMDDDTL